MSTIRSQMRTAVTSLLGRYGYEVVERQMLRQWQQYAPEKPAQAAHAALPDCARDYLKPDNPRLLALRSRYLAFNHEVTQPLLWQDGHVRPDEMLYFRGDNAYLWQLRGGNMHGPGYALAFYYARSIDHLRLLDILKEDTFFGNVTFNIAGRLVSRDLLDSITELYFLERHLSLFSLQDPSILDIGAGYGRLAHRMTCASPNIKRYVCTDAFAISTFLCEYYMQFRNLENKVNVVPLDEIEAALQAEAVDVAVNVHSFPECRLSAVDWWLSLLERNHVRYLMIVPNSESLHTVDGHDFGKVVEKHGYKLRAKEPKYGDPAVQKYAIIPAYHYLFELT